jgi:hypothetical protein
MLTGHAFNAMLKTLEEPPGHVVFILATTDPRKVPVTVLSRCLQFNLKHLPPPLVAQHLATNPDLKDDADYLPPSLPDRQGPLVQRISREARASVVEGVTRWVLARLAEEPDCTVLVAVPTSRGHQEIVRSLRDHGVAAGFAKGDDLADQVNQVQVTTYHQAKGLEWDHVVLMDLTDDRMPGYFVSHIEDPEERLEAENRIRRLVYVALTRARTSALLAGCFPFCRYFLGVPAVYIQDA